MAKKGDKVCTRIMEDIRENVLMKYQKSILKKIKRNPKKYQIFDENKLE